MNKYAERMSQSFANELDKIAAVKVARKGGNSWILPAAAGAVLTATAMQAEKDRRMGRRMRAARG